MLQQLIPALRTMVVLTVLTGFIYPGVITALCQVLFRQQANGSLITKDGHVIGSRLLGQNFVKPEYFHPRPSAAGNGGYDPTASGGSNLGPTSQRLYDRVKNATTQFRKENPDYSGPIPADALTASGSGLDPDITIANATIQAARVAKVRGLTVNAVAQLIRNNTEPRSWGFFGEPRVNVLALNLALQQLTAHP